MTNPCETKSYSLANNFFYHRCFCSLDSSSGGGGTRWEECRWWGGLSRWSSWIWLLSGVPWFVDDHGVVIPNLDARTRMVDYCDLFIATCTTIRKFTQRYMPTNQSDIIIVMIIITFVNYDSYITSRLHSIIMHQTYPTLEDYFLKAKTSLHRLCRQIHWDYFKSSHHTLQYT